jgi:hypothetical protein
MAGGLFDIFNTSDQTAAAGAQTARLNADPCFGLSTVVAIPEAILWIGSHHPLTPAEPSA